MFFWNLLLGQQVEAADWANKQRYAQANMELMAGEPHYRKGAERGRWNMMYSEDIY